MIYNLNGYNYLVKSILDVGEAGRILRKIHSEAVLPHAKCENSKALHNWLGLFQ